jgi:hypothetical protein
VRFTGPGLAIGVRFPFSRIVLESDVGGAFLLGRFIDGNRAEMGLASWRVLAALELYRHLSFFAGLGLTARLGVYRIEDPNLAYELGPDLFAGVQL